MRLRCLVFLAVVAVTHVAAIKIKVLHEDGKTEWQTESETTCVDLPGNFVDNVVAFERENDNYAVTLWGGYDCTGESRSQPANNGVIRVEEWRYLSTKPRTMSLSTCSRSYHQMCHALQPATIGFFGVVPAINACFGIFDDAISPRVFAVLLGATGFAALQSLWSSRCRFCFSVTEPVQEREEHEPVQEREEHKYERRSLRRRYLPDDALPEGIVSEVCDRGDAVYAMLVNEAANGSLDAERLEAMFDDLLEEFDIPWTWPPVKGVFEDWMAISDLDQNNNGNIELDEFGHLPMPEAYSRGM